jgi:hypothetical protein
MFELLILGKTVTKSELYSAVVRHVIAKEHAAAVLTGCDVNAGSQQFMLTSPSLLLRR